MNAPIEEETPIRAMQHARPLSGEALRDMPNDLLHVELDRLYGELERRGLDRATVDGLVAQKLGTS